MLERRGGSRDAHIARSIPKYDDPKMREVAEQMKELEHQYETRNFSTAKIFDQLFALIAKLGDASREYKGLEPIMELALKKALQSDEVTQKYGSGKNGDLREIHQEEDNLAVRDCNALLIRNFSANAKALDLRLIRSTVLNSRHGGLLQWERRNKDLEAAGVPDNIKALVFLDLIMNEAYQKIGEWLQSHKYFDSSIIRNYGTIEEARDGFSHALVSRTSELDPRPIIFYKGLCERLKVIIDEKIKEIYPENGEEMMNMWRAVNYMRLSKFNLGDPAEFRQSMYGSLVKNTPEEREKAHRILRIKIINMPDAFTSIARHTQGVSTDDIEARRIERGKNLTPAERTDYEARKRAVGKLERADIFKPYIGHLLYDAGKQQLIYCLGRSERVRSRHGTESNIVALSVRRFLIKDGIIAMYKGEGSLTPGLLKSGFESEKFEDLGEYDGASLMSINLADLQRFQV